MAENLERSIRTWERMRCNLPVRNGAREDFAKVDLDIGNVDIFNSSSLVGVSSRFELIITVWAVFLSAFTGNEDVEFPVLERQQLPAEWERLDVIRRYHIKRGAQIGKIAGSWEQYEVKDVIKDATFEFSNTCVLTTPDCGDPSVFLDAIKLSGGDALVGSKVATCTVLTYFKPAVVLWMKPGEQDVELRLYYLLPLISELDAQNYAHSFQQWLLRCTQNTSMAVTEVTSLSTQDMEKLLRLDTNLVSASDHCLHDILRLQAANNPENCAIKAWDGEISYAEFDQKSTVLAKQLVGSGLTVGDRVPVCIEKSKWAAVAILAVLKAGGVCVPIDTRHPLDRIQTILDICQSHIAICGSASSQSLLNTVGRLYVIPEQFETTALGQLPNNINSSCAAFLVFTSGSTGTPKGIVQEHGGLYAKAREISLATGMDRKTRTYQYASHSFDVTVGDYFATMLVGGRICIPSEHDRLNNIAKSVVSLNANCAFLTPTVLSQLEPSDVPCLKYIVVGGEPISREEISKWCSTTSLNAIYGTTETLIWDTLYCNLTVEDSPNSIGRPIGMAVWVVDPENHNILLPIGMIGELLIETNMLAQGYLGDSKKTKEKFIERPKWAKDHVCRQAGGFYKTGDLVRLQSDGNLLFVARKDGQVKIRGQRVELGEIEYHVAQILNDTVGVVADMIQPLGNDNKILTTFFCMGKPEGSSDLTSGDLPHMTQPDERFEHYVDRLRKTLPRLIPSYMIPSVYIPLAEIPLTQTGKVDRRKLRDMGSSVSVERFVTPSGKTNPPETPMESSIQSLWAEVLNIPPDTIGRDENFVRLGGDSVSAIKLCARARQQNMHMSVSDVFQHATLHDLASVIRLTMPNDSKPENAIPAFSLVHNTNNMELVMNEAARQCGEAKECIIDLYPCTPIQEGLLALSGLKSGKYVARMVSKLPDSVDTDRFMMAWETIRNRNEILRTRIVDVEVHGLLQAVLNNASKWNYGTDLKSYILQDELKPMAIGDALVRFGLVLDEGENNRYFVLTIHHALFDGYSQSIIHEQINRVYRGESLPPHVPFKNFVQHFVEFDIVAAEQYWRSQLANLEATPFPTVPHSYRIGAMGHLKHKTIELDWSNKLFTPSTILRAAAAVLLAKYTASEDVIFGSVLIGRQSQVPGIEEITGPTLTTVPTRVQLKWQQSIQEFLKQVYQQNVDMIPFEQTGLRRIRAFGVDADLACQFQTLFVVQPTTNSLEEESVFKFDDESQLDTFNTYPLMFECLLGQSEVDLNVSFDKSILSETQVYHLVMQLERILKYLVAGKNNSLSLRDIDAFTHMDQKTIDCWNSDQFDRFDVCVHDIIKEQVQKQQDKIAVDSWDGKISYKQLDEMSTRLAVFLAEKGVAGSPIPLLFDKSFWTVVAMLAVMKAGAVLVGLDWAQPEERLQSVLSQLKPKVVLCSGSNKQLAESLATSALVVNQSLVDKLSPKDVSLLATSPSETLFIVFTSGSTGTPKGVLITHSNMATGIKHQLDILGFEENSRVYDFTSYSFDVAWSNIIHTLAAGGCLCVPSDEDRKSSLEDSMNRFSVTLAQLTRTVSALLDPERLPSLTTLNFVGEQVYPADALKWKGHARVLNCYGPAECTIYSTLSTLNLSPTIDIGKGVGLRTWIVDSLNAARLAPIGAIGELYLEGPLVGEGYFADPTKTELSFVELPLWLDAPGRYKRAYRTGDLVKYNPDGTIVFIGRADSQVKLRGQRIELGEVEHHIRRVVPPHVDVTVEMVTPSEKSEKRNPILAAFLAGTSVPNRALLEASDLTNTIRQTLSDKIPGYMVPTAFVPLDDIPKTQTGKTDRRRLKRIGALLEVSSRQDNASSIRESPRTQEEHIVTDLCAEVLGKSPFDIGITDNFLRLGGDSVSAMRLISRIRGKGYSLTFADIFNTPRLDNMAQKLATVSNDLDDPVAPFSLLGDANKQQDIRRSVARLCDVDLDQVMDAYPCTPLQEALLALTSKDSEKYVFNTTIEIPSGIELESWKRAWELVFSKTDILRTRIVNVPSFGFVQAVVNESIQWQAVETLEKYENDRIFYNTLTFGSRLVHFAIIPKVNSSPAKMLWAIHHSLYDGYSISLIAHEIERALEGRDIHPLAPYRNFIKALSTSKAASRDFWVSKFRTDEADTFPQLPNPSHQVHANGLVEHQVDSLVWQIGNEATKSTVLRAATSILLAKYSSSDAVALGSLSIGRQAPLSGIDRIAGPTIATVPVVTRHNWEDSVQQHLQKVQSQYTRMIPYEQYGLQNIRRLSAAAENACNFQTLVVIQQEAENDGSSKLLGFDNRKDELESFNTFLLMLEFWPHASGYRLRASFDTTVLNSVQVQRMNFQLETIVKQLCGDLTRKLGDLNTCSAQDVDKITRWTPRSQSIINSCWHELFACVVLEKPGANAINSWDGQMSYETLDKLSGSMAQYLADTSLVVFGTIVPICFDNSSWAIVSMIAILKIGAVFLPLDPRQPQQRISKVLVKVGTELVLTAARYFEQLRRSTDAKIVVVDNELLQSAKGVQTLPTVDANKPAYMITTSGSTGEPKSLVMPHYALSTSIRDLGNYYQLGPNSRCLQFSSYAFDACIIEIFGTLLFGGCLCIPEDTDRLQNLANYIVNEKVDIAFLTPSVIRLIHPREVPCLRTLVSEGEPISREIVNEWSEKVRLTNAYGPTETCVICLGHDFVSGESFSMRIGRPVSGQSWIMDQTNINQLAGIGMTGELVVTGNTLALGYYNDDVRSKESFIRTADCLADLPTCQNNSRGIMYKTGDLVRYDELGNIVYVGRKDQQVKIRGQRIELGEIEYHIRRHLPENLVVVVEAITPTDNDKMILTAFLCAREPTHESTDPLTDHEISRIVGSVKPLLLDDLPSYMMPSAWIPVSKVPLTLTDKIDRRYLRELGSTNTMESLMRIKPEQSSKTWSSLTESERKICTLWARTLNIDVYEISADDKFLQIGGDSINAIKLISLARDGGIELNIHDIFKQSLRDLAERIENTADNSNNPIQPFSLLPKDVDTNQLIEEVAGRCEVVSERIDDIFPCSSLQKGLMSLTMKNPKDYVARHVIGLTDVNRTRLRDACNEVLPTVDIFRTRMVSTESLGVVQTLVKGSVFTNFHGGIADYIKEDEQRIIGLGTPLARWALLEDDYTGKIYLVLTLHHAIYDGWSLPLIKSQIERAYIDKPRQHLLPYQHFIRYIQNIDAGAVNEFWRAELDSLEARPFPSLPSPAYQPNAGCSLDHHIVKLNWPSNSVVTPSTRVRAAWSMLMAKYTDSKDVIFGATVFGRQASVLGIDRITGPTFATVPVRAKLDFNSTVAEILEQMQDQATRMIPHEQAGIQTISKISADAKIACDFQTLLVIQPKQGSEVEMLPSEDGWNQLDIFNPYLLMLECWLEDSGILIRANYDETALNHRDICRLMNQLEHILRQICLESMMPLKAGDIDFVPQQDLHDIWDWNSRLPTRVNDLAHRLFAARAEAQPAAPAIDAWDGDLTYEQLHMKTNHLARLLIDLGVVPEISVAICFEKSKWTAVCMLATLKSGGISVAMDHSQPIERLKSIVAQSNALLILASPQTKNIAKQLGKEVLIVDANLFKNSPAQNSLPASKVEPRNTAYITFSSGSTGEPKGARVSHSNICSAVKYQAEVLGFNSSCRVYDFASYSFDVAWSNALQTLCAGGCLCVPSESDRKDSIIDSIKKFRANLANLTPSVIRLLRPRDLAHLEVLLISGEPSTQSELLDWALYTHTINTYGPSESTWKSTLAIIDPEKPARPKIGKGFGAVTWIADPEDATKLVPIGTVGELILEGPLVGQGYISHTALNARAFITRPPWLHRDVSELDDESHKVYRTGDLVKYDPFGNLIFVGRRDGQIKLRGQRVELGDIEHHIRSLLPGSSNVVVEVIKPLRSDNTILVAFIETDDAVEIMDIPQPPVAKIQNSGTISSFMQEIINAAEDKLPDQIPGYMIPSAWFPIKKVPSTTSGKTDRRQVRLIGSKMTLQELVQFGTVTGKAKREPSNDNERLLRKLWARALGVDAQSIGADDSFFRTGGDSIGAMRLSSLARDSNIKLPVSVIFRNPRLSSMANNFRALSGEPKCDTEPFSLLSGSKNESFALQLADLCGLKPREILDAFPCTPLQEGMMALSEKSPGDYVSRIEVDLPGVTNISRFKEAWESVTESLDILRTRIVDLPSFGLIQVVTNTKIEWEELHSSQNEATNNLWKPMFGLGTELVNWALMKKADSSYRFFWTIHHSLYDAWSLGLILRQVEHLYFQTSLQPALKQFRSFVDGLTQVNLQTQKDYWKSELSDLQANTFPPLPSSDYQIQANSTAFHHVKGLSWPKIDVTPSTIVRATCALLISKYTGEDDVVFGSTVNGRNFSVDGIDKVAGPTIASVPVRTRIDWNRSIVSFLRQLQTQAADMMPYEQMGLSNISNVSKDAQTACDFQSLVLIQPQFEDDPFRLFDFDSTEVLLTRDMNTYAMILNWQLERDGFSLHINFDEIVMDCQQVQRLLYQAENIIRQLCTVSSAGTGIDTLRQLQALSEEDQTEILSWNSELPTRANGLVHHIFEDRVMEKPHAPAICSWDGNLCYHELSTMSTQLAHYLVAAGLTNGSIVPLCFRKSKWMAVAMLAVMKAGAASVAIDCNQPIERLRALVRQVDPNMILASSDTESLAISLDELHKSTVIAVDRSEILKCMAQDVTLATPNPDAALYIAFTSGSTGKSKGAIISHENFCSAFYHQSKALFFDTKPRVFDFASYSFDVAWSNMLHTLCAGGCLCIPSQKEREEALEKSMEKMGVTFAHLTPTVADMLDPARLPSLKYLHFIGEPVSHSSVRKWYHTGVQMLNTYGPAECTIVATLGAIDKESALPPDIGKGIGVITWIVDTQDASQLAPIGSVGELLLDGPLVGRGYLNDLEKTKAAFIEPSQTSYASTAFGTHRHVSDRLYKTGDLVRYNSDGSITFVGRVHGGQVKINGQRVELGEIDHHIRRALPESVTGTAEMIVPSDRDSPILVAFIASSETTNGSQWLRTVVSKVHQTLDNALPPYMIPAAFVPLAELPMTATGKMDRRGLRATGSRLSLENLMGFGHLDERKRKPRTRTEVRLANIWANLLQLDSEDIFAEDNFLRRGGNSITAMRLVALARSAKMNLSVASVFRNPRLCDLAMVAEPSECDLEIEVDRFSLVRAQDSLNTLLDEICVQTDLSPTEIVDVYPCSPLQQSLLALTSRRPWSYTSRRVYEVSRSVGQQDLHEAWDKVVEMNDILRSIVIDTDTNGLVQVVTKGGVVWATGTDLHAYLITDSQNHFSLGGPLARAACIDGEQSRYFVLSIHHALYDAWSMPLIVQQLEDIVQAKTPLLLTPFNRFIGYLQSSNSISTLNFWKEELNKNEISAFPSLPHSDYEPRASCFVEHEIRNVSTPAGGYTASTMVRAALALLLACYTDSSDVCFGATVIGRQAQLPGIELISGPTIATVPVRVRLNWVQDSVQILLDRIQSQAVTTIPFEQIGLSQIGKISSDTARACKFQTLLVIQSKESSSASQGILSLTGSGTPLDGFNPYLLMIECWLEDSSIEFRANYDDTVIEKTQMLRLFQQLETIIRFIWNPQNQELALQDADLLGRSDEDQIWQWNCRVPDRITGLVHDHIIQQAVSRPESQAISAWDGSLTYGELHDLSSRLATYLASRGIQRGSIVPLCFHKSMWTSVAVLAVMKSGGASIMMDCTQPEDRLRSIVDQVKPKLVLASTLSEDLSNKLYPKSTVIVDALNLHTPACDIRSDVKPADTLYIAFTSGTTGLPKGAQVSHSNFCSALHHQTTELGFSQDSRVFDFASYSFDVAWSNILHTLCTGGCLCVPSEDDRMNRINESMNEMCVTIAHLTPTVAALLQPKQLVTLRTLIFIGEPLASSDVQRWPPKIQLINTYGPAEATVTTTSKSLCSSEEKAPTIGTGFGSVTWVINPRTTRLAPVGVPGELVLEGPLVGKGYLNDRLKTNESFLDSPTWLLEGNPRIQVPGRDGWLYRTGDLVKYNENGELLFIGRKDKQVKVHGQRVELGDIEYHIAKSFPEAEKVVVELVNSVGASGDMLICFIQIRSKTGPTELNDSNEADTSGIIRRCNNKIRALLPSFMVPTGYLILPSIPTTVTGKTNRRRLQEIGRSKSIAEMTRHTQLYAEARPPSTPKEHILQKLWSNILGIAAEKIDTDDNFLGLGGDSILAMRLVGQARKNGIVLTVADVFESANLSELADTSVVTRSPDGSESSDFRMQPFAAIDFVGNLENFLKNEIAPLMSVDPATIRDVFPATDFQRQCIEGALEDPKLHWNFAYIDFDRPVDIDRLREAIKATVQTLEILRTGFVYYSGNYLQVILDSFNPTVDYYYTEEVEKHANSICAEDRQREAQINRPMIRFILLQDTKLATRFIIRISHAHYDGISIPLIMDGISAAYEGRSPLPCANFSHFVQTRSRTVVKDTEFWRHTLSGSTITTLPTLTNGTLARRTTLRLMRKISPPKMTSKVTPATFLTLCWSKAIATITGKQDVVFGRLVSGRSTTYDFHAVVGPCVNIVPVRVRLDQSTPELLNSIHSQALKSAQHESMDTSQIIKHCTDWPEGIELRTVLQYQNIDETPQMSLDGASGALKFLKLENQAFLPGGLWMLVRPREDHFELIMSADSRSYSLEIMTELLESLCAHSQSLG